MSAPTCTERYAHGNSYCHTDADVAERRAYAYACSSSESDAQTDLLVCAHAVFPTSGIV